MAFSCPICQKSFTAMQSRDTHVVLIHEKSGRFECKICHKKFDRESHLKRHERIHTGEKPFACETCKMRFNQKDNLKSHLNIHTEKKCTICSKVFNTAYALRAHFLAHSGDKPFKCDQCEYSSAYKQNLKSHQKRHHSTTRPETSGGRLARGDDREKLPVAIEQPVASDGSGGANYNLRVRTKKPNYSVDQNDVEDEKNTRTNSRGNSESGSDPQENDRKPAEPDEESGLEDELVVLDSEDEQNGDEGCSDEPLKVLESNESRAAREYDVISLGSDDEDGDLSPESRTVTSANLTVVYGVEYRGPDESD